MHDIIIYIGTSKRDIVQYEYLINSIRAFNVDNIPVVTCVKDSDIDLYKNKFALYDITFIKDSDVYDTHIDNAWYKQQLIKLNFWKLNISKFILQMDSDSFFIRNFYISDFLLDNNTPYTIMHENKELKEFFARHNLHNCKKEENANPRIAQGFAESSDRIRSIFGLNKINAEYDFGHTPLIINTDVWRQLEQKYLKPNNISYEQLLEHAGNDQQWYGETLLVLKTHPIFPKENIFKTFHYPENWIEFKNTDNIDNIRYNYHGICLQSNWASPDSDVFNTIYNAFFTKDKIPKMFNGQFGEDQWIIENLGHILPKTGTVIDVGADQPIYGSNTYLFEKYLGYDSICIDADPRVIDNLSKFRQKVISCAVSDKNGKVKFHQHDLAGISSISDIGTESIDAKTLNTILEENNISSSITILDIDTEGHELEVCNGLDWHKYYPLIVIIEYVSPSGGNIKDKIINFFNSLGFYKLVHTTQANLIFQYDKTI